MKPWTADEISLLMSRHAAATNAVIAAELVRSEMAVRSMASKLGLSKRGRKRPSASNAMRSPDAHRPRLDIARLRRERVVTPEADRPHTSATTGAIYDGAELRRTPGVDPERFAAFDMPSRRGRWRVWPDGRREVVA